jgi:ketosteroid isomerase-like protein
MSEGNVKLMKEGFEEFVRTGEPPWEMFDEQIEIHDHDTPDQGAYRGRDGLQRWLEDWGAAWADWSIEPEEYIDAGDSVVVVFRMNAIGRGSGLELKRQDALVYEIREGKIVRGDYFNSRDQALEAAGLAG